MIETIMKFLEAAAAVCTVAGFILEVWRTYKHRRMERRRKE